MSEIFEFWYPRGGQGYCLEMICADFLAGATLDEASPAAFSVSIQRLVELLPGPQRLEFIKSLKGICVNRSQPKQPRISLQGDCYIRLCREVLERDNWRCQNCGGASELQVHHIQFRSQMGGDREENLVTLCATCHRELHDAAK